MEAHTSNFVTGKGISDQDRNILSNQLLILDFLKSAAVLLRDGGAPPMTNRNLREKRRVGSDDDDSLDLHLGEDVIVRGPEVTERGTVLITLRNAPPYTLWCVEFFSHSC